MFILCNQIFNIEGYRWKNSLRFHMKSGKCNPVTTTTFQCPYCEILLPSQKDLDNHAPNCLNEIIAKQQELPLEAISKKRLRFEEATSSSSSAAIEKEFYPESLGLLEDDDESSRTTISFGAQDAKGDFVSSSSNHLGSAINVEQLLSDSADESLVQFDSADEFDEDTVVASSQLTPRHGQFRIQISGNNEILDEEETSYFDPAAMLNELVNLRGDLCEVRKDISDLQEGVFKKLNRLQQSMDEIRKAIIK